MSLVSGISALAARIASEFNTLRGAIGPDEDYSAYLNSQLGALPAAAGIASENQAGVTQFANSGEMALNASTSKAVSVAHFVDGLSANQDRLALLTTARRGTDAQRQALSGSSQVFDGLLYHATDTGITWKYVGTTWRAWDSWWVTYTPSMVNFSGTALVAAWRYRAGCVLLRLAINCTSVGSGNITFTVPIPANSASATLVRGSSIWVKNGTRYDFQPDLQDTGTLIFRAMSALGGAMTQVSTTYPVTWAPGDLAILEVEYDIQ